LGSGLWVKPGSLILGLLVLAAFILPAWLDIALQIFLSLIFFLNIKSEKRKQGNYFSVYTPSRLN
jgi:hypothetical protein